MDMTRPVLLMFGLLAAAVIAVLAFAQAGRADDRPAWNDTPPAVTAPPADVPQPVARYAPKGYPPVQ